LALAFVLLGAWSVVLGADAIVWGPPLIFGVACLGCPSVIQPWLIGRAAAASWGMSTHPKSFDDQLAWYVA